jgi:hypothetical protein
MALTRGNGNRLQYITIICLFTQFPLLKSSVPNRCHTMGALSLMSGFQLDNRCNSGQRQNVFLCLHTKQILGCNQPHAERYWGVKQTLTAMNFLWNLPSSPVCATHLHPSVKFRDTCRLIYIQPIRQPCMVLRLNINQKKM